MCPSFDGEEPQPEERKEHPTQEQKESLLGLVVQGDYDQLVEILGTNNWNLNFVVDGTTLLHEAARNTNFDIARLLIEHGMQHDIRDEFYNTPADVLRQQTYDGVAIPAGFDDLLNPPAQDSEDEHSDGSHVEESGSTDVHNQTGHPGDEVMPHVLGAMLFPGGASQ